MTSGQMSLALVTKPWCLSLQTTSPSVMQFFQALVVPSACQCCRSGDQNFKLNNAALKSLRHMWLLDGTGVCRQPGNASADLFRAQ